MLTEYLTFERNNKLLLLSLGFTVVTFAVYMMFFDILVPFVPDGSVRFNFGFLFAVPVSFLLSAQTLFVTYLLHVTIKAVDEGKRDLLKSYFATSVLIFLFSLYYVFVPYYGPYTFIVYFLPNENFPRYSYPLLVFWTITIIGVTWLTIRRIFNFEYSRKIGPMRILILSASMLALAGALACG